MKKSKTVIKTILVLPLVLGLFFSWFLAKQSQVLAQTATLVATVRINSLEVEITPIPSVSVGERFRVEATVSNLGKTKIKKAEAIISFSDSGLKLSGNAERKMGVILPNKDKTVRWWLTAKEEGIYFITVTVSGIEEETNQIITASDTQHVVVEESSSLDFFKLAAVKIYRLLFFFTG